MATATGSAVFAVEIASADNGDGWVHLLPAGRFKGRDGRGPYHLRDGEAIIAQTAKLGMDLPVDYEHQIDHATKNGQPAPAAGWIKALKADVNGIWGQVEWTSKAREMLDRKEYRFISPVFSFHKQTGEITILHRAGLTNNPNLHLTALASAELPDGETEMPPDPYEALRTGLVAALALPEDADDAAILAAVEALTAPVEEAPETAARRDTKADAGVMQLAAELNRVQAREAEAAAQTLVNGAVTSGKLPPFLREWGLALCREKPDTFREFAEKMVPLVAPGPSSTASPTRLGTGHAASTPSLTPQELALCANMGIKPEDYHRTVTASGRSQM